MKLRRVPVAAGLRGYRRLGGKQPVGFRPQHRISGRFAAHHELASAPKHLAAAVERFPAVGGGKTRLPASRSGDTGLRWQIYMKAMTPRGRQTQRPEATHMATPKPALVNA